MASVVACDAPTLDRDVASVHGIGLGGDLGVVHLKDVVKGGIKERFAELRRMGIRTVMITGDNPLTAQAIATEAAVTLPDEPVGPVHRAGHEGHRTRSMITDAHGQYCPRLSTQ